MFARLDEFYGQPKNTCKNAIKNNFGIKSIKDLNHEELSYLTRYTDNILLANGIDIDEEKI
jgi:hypothetical protein